MSLLPKVGLAALFGALALAPLLGGTPTGYLYATAAFGGDAMLGALRALLLVAALCLLLADARRTEGASPLSKVAGVAVWTGFGLTVLSLLVHSAFLTRPALLFLMLPDALNWLCCALAFTLARRCAGDGRAALGVVIALVAGGAVCAALGVQMFGATPAAERAAFRNSATFFSPNFAAGFFALVLPVGVALFVSAARRSLLATVASGAACALMFGALISTGSRAGVGLALVGLVVALVLALVVARRLPWARVGALVALFALIGFVFRAPLVGRASGSGATGATTSAAAAGDQGHSGAFRKETWKGTLRMAQAHPLLGAGPGTFPVTYPPHATVGWTGLAHSSYLQVAGEQGFPALAAYVAALAAALLAGVTTVFKFPAAAAKEETHPRPPSPAAGEGQGERAILLCGLIGGLVAAAGRGVFDSEWAVLGDALPFWAVAGLVAGWGVSLVPVPRVSPLRYAAGVGVAAALVATLVLRSGNAARDAAITIQRERPDQAQEIARGAAASVWPPDPQFAYLAGDPKRAAELEPSGKRFFQLARAAETAGDDREAIALYQRSLKAEPNNLQTRKRLAEAQERTGDAAGALATWRSMVDLSHGPVGQVRAIPELPDTLPAFASAALADDAAKRQAWADAERQYHDAQTVIEEYSQTPPAYQQTELLTVSDPAGRRAEVRTLYEKVIAGRQEALRRLGQPEDAAALDAVKQETLSRLDAFLTLDQLTGGGK